MSPISNLSLLMLPVMLLGCGVEEQDEVLDTHLTQTKSSLSLEPLNADSGESANRILISNEIAPLLDDSTCPDYYSCVWTASYYGGTRRKIGASYAGDGWHQFENIKYSAKNKFINKGIQLQGSDPRDNHCLRPTNTVSTAGAGWEWFRVIDSCP